MSTIIKFPFEEKEGKYFAPIVSEETTYKVSSGAVVADIENLNLDENNFIFHAGSK